MNRRLSILVALVAIFALAGSASAAAPISSAQAPTLKPTAATLYVAPAGSDTTNCTSSAAPCKTITYALGQAPAGATISVGPGTYAEQVIITQPVRLVGSGAGATTIDGTGVALSYPTYGLVHISGVSGAVSFSGFTVRDAALAAGLYDPFDLVVENGHAKATVTLSGNVFRGTGTAADYVVGVYVQNSPAVTMNVTQNTFTDLYQAVFFENGGPATVSDNTFTALSMADYAPIGVFVLVDDGSTVSHQTVGYNSFNNYAGYGVGFEAGYNGGADTGYITNSSINNNTFGLGPVTNDQYAAAISLFGHDAIGTTVASTISGLKVTKNSGTVVGPTKAISVYDAPSVSYTATKNSITVL